MSRLSRGKFSEPTGLLPLTKAGPGDKQPAFIILRRHCCRFLILSVFILALLIVKLIDDGARFSDVRVRLHGVTHNLNEAILEHVQAHAEIARVGEEFGEHLDRDLRELEMGQQLLKLMKAYQVNYKNNVSVIISEVTDTLKSDVTRIGINASNGLITRATDDLMGRLMEASATLFSLQDVTVGKLVKHLAAGAKDAAGRREELRGEVTQRLHDAKLKLDNVLDDAAEWVQEPRNEEIMKFEGDDYWEKETDIWHNKTIEEFFHRLDKWLHPSFNASKLGEENAAKFISVHESSQFYTNTSSLFLELREARADLDVDAAKWYDIQVCVKCSGRRYESVVLGW